MYKHNWDSTTTINEAGSGCRALRKDDQDRARELIKPPSSSCLLGTKLVYEGNLQRCRTAYERSETGGGGEWVSLTCFSGSSSTKV